MILAFSLVAGALLAGMQTAPEPDIVVIGRRLAALSVNVGRDSRGRFTCGLSQSSGNLRLDDKLCRTAAACVAKGAGDQAGVTACIERRKPALLADLRKNLAGVRR